MLLERKKARGFVAVHSITTIYYLLARSLTREKAASALAALLQLVRVVPVSHKDVVAASALGWKDLEDALQAVSAAKAEVDLFVTRDPAGFRGMALPIASPAEAHAALAG